MTRGKFYTLKKRDLQKFLDRLGRDFRVFAPVRDGGSWNFRRLESGEKVSLKGYLNTEFPPTRLFLPEMDVLLEYDGGKVSEKSPSSKSVVFGIRPCDTNALVVMDKVMLGHDHAESHYRKRRENTLILAVKCREPCENCFCESMGTDELYGGFDLLFTEHEDDFHVMVGSVEGAGIVAGNERLFIPCNRKARRRKLKMKKRLNTEDLPRIMLKMKDSKVWEDVARRCLSCASCTFSCPTCYCFNLLHEADIGNLKKGRVSREHDYCMLPRFSRVAGGVVFREPRKERVKQFFYHKLAYGKKREGMFHCVGCGRCITECMAGIDITEEVKKIRDEHEKG
jgi:sulfhydrogenase subunit beta (sulfur reductase)